MLSMACAKGDDSISASGFGPGPWELPGESGDSASTEPDPGTTTTSNSADGTSTTTTTTDPPQTSGPATTGPPPPGSTSSDDAPGTFGDDGDGEQPGSGWWAHCADGINCDPGFACLTTDAGTDGVCTNTCLPAGDPGSCGASPGGTNVPVCLTVGPDSVCALSCEGGLTCPGGMICINESDDTGPISICV